MGKMRNEYQMLVGKPEGRDHSEDLGVDGRIILKFILGKHGLGMWIGFVWLSTGTGDGLFLTR
jgi:hypothetical protein